MNTATVAAQTYSLTDTIWLLDLQRDYGKARGTELFIERSSKLELERLRSGDPREPSCRDKDGRLLSPLALERLADRLEERLRSLTPGWLTRVERPGEVRIATSKPVYGDGAKPFLAPKPKAPKRWSGSPRSTPVEPALEVRLLKTRSRIAVRLTAAAFDAIWDECRLHDWEVESGGGLYTSKDWARSWERELKILEADVAASKQSFTGVTLSGSAMRTESDRLTRRYGGDKMLIVGDWHSHPQRSLEPSAPDLAGWGHSLAESGASVYIGLIATEHRNSCGEGWRRPELSAWVLRRDDWEPGRRATAEPADVVIPS